MSISEHLLQVRDHEAEGYTPVVDFEAWRVAILNFSSELKAKNICSMQRHNETDEVFVLLHGRCILFLGLGDDSVKRVFAVEMQPGKVYNVKRKTWHNHTLTRDAKVLIVENRDTTYDNSPFCPLTEAQKLEIMNLTRTLWPRHHDPPFPT